MGKKKIGELYGKPIVIGNKNKVKKTEIHYEDLKSSEKYLYCEVNNEAASNYALYSTKLKKENVISPVFALFAGAPSLEEMYEMLKELIPFQLEFPEIIFLGASNGESESMNAKEFLSDLEKEGYVTKITKEQFYTL